MNPDRTILFVEDDPDDREMLSQVVNDLNPSIHAAFAENGIKALEYLDAAKQAKLPCLIVLDLNLPILDGKETFRKIRNDTSLGRVPVVIFTSSHNPNDKAMFHELGIEFITKPNSFAHMSPIVSRMISACCSTGNTA